MLTQLGPGYPRDEATPDSFIGRPRPGRKSPRAPVAQSLKGAQRPGSAGWRPFRYVPLVMLLLSACTGGGAAVGPTPAPGVADPLLEVVQREGSVVVVVQLAVPRGSAGSYDAARIKKAQRRLMSDLGPRARVVERFGRREPQIMLRVDARALQELRQSDQVVNISLHEKAEADE